MQKSAKANTEQAALWNDGSGKAWVDLQPILDGVLAPFERLLADAGSPGEGGRVLDVGCGAGATTMAMARGVGSKGHCVGLDISQMLTSLATMRAREARLGNVEFVTGDAQTHAFEPGRFDAVVSRFGVMFFDDPAAAFANIRRAVKPVGKLAFIAWRSPEENPFMTAAARAAAPFLPPSPRPDPAAPGPFAFADEALVRRILETSGWTSVELKRADIPCQVPERDLMTYVTRLGPVGAALRVVDPATAERIKGVLPSAFVPFIEDRMARFNAACWLVTARA